MLTSSAKVVKVGSVGTRNILHVVALMFQVSRTHVIVDSSLMNDFLFTAVQLSTMVPMCVPTCMCVCVCVYVCDWVLYL